MKHYEKRLEEDLSNLLDQIRLMGNMVEKELNNAIHAFMSGDQRLANETVLKDLPINRKMREIDRLCHGFIARHLPSGGHLRLISSVLRINIELERIGDYAVVISRETSQADFSSMRDSLLGHDLESIATEAKNILRQALTNFYDENAEMAKATMLLPSHMEGTLDGIYASLMSGEHTKDIQEAFTIFSVLSRLKRVVDQAKNICEETVFAVTGETKAQKVYNILFIDRDNSCLSQIAKAIADKNYPNSGRYSSVGKTAAEMLNPEMIEFMREHGLDLEGIKPKAMDYLGHELAQFHVIVSLQGPQQDYFETVPFHTSFLEWDVGDISGDIDDAEAKFRCEDAYRELSYLIKGLMELLRGEGAD